MRNDQDRPRYEMLRHNEPSLTPEEREEMAALAASLLQSESEALSTSIRTAREESDAVERQNRSLERLVHRKRALIERLEVVLSEARSERRALDSELASVLSGDTEASSPE